MADHNNYDRISDAVFKKMLDARAAAFNAQVDHGKWLISSLFLIHGSAIAGLVFRSTTAGAPPYLSAVSWFVAGIILALASGFTTWCNFGIAAQQYDEWADPNVLADVKHWPKAPSRAFSIKFTRFLSLCFGFLSVAALVAGAVHVLKIWH
ncbi:hypothetical protein RPMA_12375 [Tardiphaga alba]|uniref:Uncharacterized protein n=1 Tax=Tardiphaga alba TaxID=340268 RepID=A0ABX8AAU6_9BRAD|nr:hypothetical protein [Tardiphaga alba]QUS39543.1 hypothetical protein RPMA_12375 [Tardiphaga alba]